jgi:Tol biopolymer transport system component
MRWLLPLLLVPSLAWGRGGYDANHMDVRWHTYETEHFYFHWPESKRDPSDPHYFTTEFTVSELARIAEESHASICGQLDFFPTEKTHVVVYDQDEGWEGNGYAIAEWDLTGFAARWGPTFRMRGRMEFLSDVFVHEYAHIISLKAYSGLSERANGFTIGGMVEDEEWLQRWGWDQSAVNFDVGFDLTASVHTPFWWAEGGAEYWSHMAGYNFWGTSRDAFLRMTFLEDRVLDADEWTTRIDKVGFDGERGYNQGYAFGLYLADRFGTDTYSKMAAISGDKWHYSWDRVVEKATGVDADELYADWVSWLSDRYDRQRDAIVAKGLVTGGELRLTEPPWSDPDEDWTKLSKAKQDEAMDGATAYQEILSYSPDGEYVVWFEQGMNLRRIRPEQWGAVSGTWVDPEDTKALKTWGKQTYSIDWAQYYKPAWSPDSKRFVVVGNEDVLPNAQAAMNAGFTFDADGYNWSQLLIGAIDDSGKRLKVRWEKVPGTLRAEEVAWSPDGETLAYVRYDDGTNEIYTVRPDGSERTKRTDFGDGTQVQGLSFSDDGRYLLTSLFRNYQQDLWLFELATGAWTRLTDTKPDETDPSFGPDGRVWFTSDIDGVFNVYALDLYSGEVRKQTELLGGAYAAEPAPGGLLFYTGITGHGFRIHGVNASALKDAPVAYPGACPTGCPGAERYLAFRPLDRSILDNSKRYSAFRGQLPLSAWPTLRTTDRNVEVGADVTIGDAVEGHYLELGGTFGKDNYLYATYWNSLFFPNIQLGYSRYSYKGTYGFGTDLDGLPETDDLLIVDSKFEQVSDDVWAFLSYSPSWTLYMGLGADASWFGFREVGDGNRYKPYIVNAGVGAYLEWSPHDPWYSGEDWINPRGSRRLYLDYSYRWTRVLDTDFAGAVYDDGELLDRYSYHRLMASYTEFIPINWGGKTPRHTLQLDFDFGWISRNVITWDEFLAGGRHPYHWGNGTIGNNVQFSGYEGWSLNGETMMIANASYRFPIARNLHLKTGPIYTSAVWMQVFGSIGNLWGYRVDGEAYTAGGSVVATDPGNVRREIPFVDYAAKNSTPNRPNYALSDVGLELRIRSFIWNDWDWDSFVRLAYGLRPTAGVGDVNADGIQSSIARDAVTELSSEFEPPRLRVYLGIGTGW